MRLTKIVCTLGPASEDLDVLEKMVRSGMDVARLNFSHGTHDEHFTMLTRLRTVARSVGRTVAAIQDLCGPKIRLSETEGEGAAFERGSTVRFYREAVKANSKQFSCTFPSLIADLRLGDRILIRDGRIQLVVVATEPDRVSCHVVQGGQFHSGAGINLPGVKLSTSALTEKDRHDLQWGIENEVDYVALSFVRSPHDVLQLRRILHEHTSDIQVIAKLEKPEAVEHLADIIEVSDAVMVARGDLGVEMSLEKVPGIQKRIIAEAARQEKPVITATEMLQSMIHSPTPTLFPRRCHFL